MIVHNSGTNTAKNSSDNLPSYSPDNHLAVIAIKYSIPHK